jgi:hypothetical protein
VTTPGEIGRSAEDRVAAILQGARVVQSGGGKFIKLDVRDIGKFIYSVKATRRFSDAAVRAIWNLWQETRIGSRGFAGHGNGAKPAMVFEIKNELFVLMRLEDHAAMATGEIEPYVIRSKGQQRRANILKHPREG